MSVVADPIRGRALVLGDHVNADVLHPSSFFSLDEGKVRGGFLGATGSQHHDALAAGRPIVVVAGRNFGCGSSRETTVQAFRLAGVRAVVALSFGRIFLRNLLNVGVEGFELAAPPEPPIRDGDEVEIDAARAHLTRVADGAAAVLRARDPYLEAVARGGGLLPLLETLPT